MDKQAVLVSVRTDKLGFRDKSGSPVQVSSTDEVQLRVQLRSGQSSFQVRFSQNQFTAIQIPKSANQNQINYKYNIFVNFTIQSNRRNQFDKTSSVRSDRFGIGQSDKLFRTGLRRQPNIKIKSILQLQSNQI